MANYFLDELSIVTIFTTIDEFKPQITNIIKALSKITSTEFCILQYFEDFYGLPVQGQSLGQLLYKNQQDGEIRDLLVQLDIAISQGESFKDIQALDGGYSYAKLASSEKGGLVTHLDSTTYEWWKDETMCSVFDIHSLNDSLRKLFKANNYPEHLFLQYCEAMFDNIHFHECPSTITKIGFSFNQIIDRALTHFTYLNDFASNDFQEGIEPHQIIARAASHGVEISPESTNTHRDTRAMAERNIKIGDATIRCEWHTKFEHNKGRIHFYPWTKNYDKSLNSLVNNRLIVGIITDHLK